jgi:hypothetical protein
MRLPRTSTRYAKETVNFRALPRPLRDRTALACRYRRTLPPSLPRVPANVSLLNLQPTLTLGGGTTLHARYRCQRLSVISDYGNGLTAQGPRSTLWGAQVPVAVISWPGLASVVATSRG